MGETFQNGFLTQQQFKVVQANFYQLTAHPELPSTHWSNGAKLSTTVSSGCKEATRSFLRGKPQALKWISSLCQLFF